MATVFFKSETHRCIRFDDLAEGGDVQSNQYLIVDGDKGMLLDPGGSKLFGKMMVELPRYFSPQKLGYIFLSHQDPDVGAALNGYLLITDAKVCFPSIWERFIPSFCAKSLAQNRMVLIPYTGMRLRLGGTDLLLIPAHFLHSPGNIQVYDPISKTLFSGDLGAAFPPAEMAHPVVADFEGHLRFMEGFHRRYMASNKACRRWATMVRSLDIERIAPQHGAMFEGKPMVNRFIEWVAKLECGVDLMQ